MADQNDESGEDFLEDPDAVEIFTHYLDSQGIVVSSVRDGVVIGLSKEKLAELLQIASENEDGRIIMFVKKGLPDETLN